MENQPPIYLTDRQKAILFAIIEEYAEMAAPVGSVTLAKLFNVSSATIRSEMARLEELGLIASPHTSAGRIPTDAGYRFYVNNLVERENLSSADFSDSYSDSSTSSQAEYDEEESDSAYLDDSVSLHLDSFYHRISPSRALSAGLQDKNRGLHALEVRINSQAQVEYAIRTAVDMLVELTSVSLPSATSSTFPVSPNFFLSLNLQTISVSKMFQSSSIISSLG